VRAVFVSLERLQQDLDRREEVNALLVSTRGHARRGPGDLEALVRRRAALEDVGLKLRRSCRTGASSKARADCQRCGPLRARGCQDFHAGRLPVLTYLGPASAPAVAAFLTRW